MARGIGIRNLKAKRRGQAAPAQAVAAGGDSDLVTIAGEKYARSFPRGQQPAQGKRLSPRAMASPGRCPNGWSFMASAGRCMFNGGNIRDSDWVVGPSGYSGAYPEEFNPRDEKFRTLRFLRCKSGTRKNENGKCVNDKGAVVGDPDIQVCPSSYKVDEKTGNCKRNHSGGRIIDGQWKAFMEQQRSAAAAAGGVGAAVPAVVVSSAAPVQAVAVGPATPAVVIADNALPDDAKALVATFEKLKASVNVSIPREDVVRWAVAATEQNQGPIRATMADGKGFLLSKTAYAKYGGGGISSTAEVLTCFPTMAPAMMGSDPAGDAFQSAAIDDGRLAKYKDLAKAPNGMFMNHLYTRWVLPVAAATGAKRSIPKYRYDYLEAMLAAYDAHVAASAKF